MWSTRQGGEGRPNRELLLKAYFSKSNRRVRSNTTMSAEVSDIRREHKVVLIKIPRSAPTDANAEALMEATSKWWVVAESRREGGPASPDYALAVINGRVVSAFRITGWRAAPTGPRWGFTGDLSQELTALYRGLDVTHYFPPGAANPLRYVHCETPTAYVKRATNAARDPQWTELEDIVRRLNDEPLTHLMLGHRELFIAICWHGSFNTCTALPIRYSDR